MHIKKYSKIIKSFLFLLIIISVFQVNFVFAGEDEPGNRDAGNPTKFENPLGKTITPQLLIGQIINTVLGIVGSLALIMFVYGGLTWMTASGSNEKIQKGKDILMWATLGLVVIFSAYAMVRFVLEALNQTK